MIHTLFEYIKKPTMYALSSSEFWNDSYISKNMLRTHLDPNIDAASRNFKFIDQSVKWLNSIAPVETHPNVLDLGCGPGLYADRLNSLGYQVTGIDFSKRSIEYAKKTNKNNEYIYMNYLEIEYENQFDLIMIIYCDFAVLKPTDRKKLLKKIYKALKPGGKFIFDVFTSVYYKDKYEQTSWAYIEKNGFFNKEPHLCLEAHHIYENNVRLNQYLIIDENGHIDNYLIWDTFFTKETILQEIRNLGFNSIEFYSNVCGYKFREDSETMCLVLNK